MWNQKTLEIYAENNSLDFECVMEHIMSVLKDKWLLYDKLRVRIKTQMEQNLN